MLCGKQIEKINPVLIFIYGCVLTLIFIVSNERFRVHNCFDEVFELVWLFQAMFDNKLLTFGYSLDAALSIKMNSPFYHVCFWLIFNIYDPLSYKKIIFMSRINFHILNQGLYSRKYFHKFPDFH